MLKNAYSILLANIGADTAGNASDSPKFYQHLPDSIQNVAKCSSFARPTYTSQAGHRSSSTPTFREDRKKVRPEKKRCCQTRSLHFFACGNFSSRIFSFLNCLVCCLENATKCDLNLNVRWKWMKMLLKQLKNECQPSTFWKTPAGHDCRVGVLVPDRCWNAERVNAVRRPGRAKFWDPRVLCKHNRFHSWEGSMNSL